MKNTRRGGWIVFLVIWNFLLSYGKLIRVCSGLENKTQSRITLKVERKIETEILYWFLSQTESTSSPLVLPREFTIISTDYKCSSTLARDFQCSSIQTRDFLMLKHAGKRLQNTSLEKQSLNNCYEDQCSVTSKYNFWYKT